RNDKGTERGGNDAVGTDHAATAKHLVQFPVDGGIEVGGGYRAYLIALDPDAGGLGKRLEELLLVRPIAREGVHREDRRGVLLFPEGDGLVDLGASLLLCRQEHDQVSLLAARQFEETVADGLGQRATAAEHQRAG